jgi:hypothetical protein
MFGYVSSNQLFSGMAMIIVVFWDQIGPKVSWAADSKKDWINSLEERLGGNEEDELIRKYGQGSHKQKMMYGR